MSDQPPNTADAGSPTGMAATSEANAANRKLDPEPEDESNDDMHSESENSATDSESSDTEDRAQPQAQHESMAEKANVTTRPADPCPHYTLRKRVTAPVRLMQIRLGRACSGRGVV